MTWFYLTLLAVLFQTGRNLLQKSLRTTLDTISVSWARILFISPLLLLGLAYLYKTHSEKLLPLGFLFFIHCFFAALTQILGTLCLVELFSRRNFVVGIAFMKTDTIQVAVLAALFLSESLTLSSIIAIVLSVVGLLLLTPSKTKQPFRFTLLNPSILLGLGTGFFLSSTTIFMKKAMFLIGKDTEVLSIASVFIIYTIMQNVMYVGYQIYHKKLTVTLLSMLKEWEKCSLIGFFSMGGTICWLSAFLLHTVAHVKVVAQLEIILSLLLTHHFFKEKSTRYELIGVLLVMISTLMIVLT